MTKNGQPRSGHTDCAVCPLRGFPLFKPFGERTLAFMQRFKMGELTIAAGATILSEGTSSPQLYTTLTGMGLRYKTLEDGARQIVGFVLPGDFLGMQAAVMDEMKHSVEATTAMRLCVFDRRKLWEVFLDEPQRGFDLTWLAAIEEHFLGEALASIGQRSGIDRLSWALIRIYRRLEALGLRDGDAVPLPYRQQDLADALGLSVVHVNRTLGRLRDRKLVIWRDGLLRIPDLQKLATMAGFVPDRTETRPLV